MSGPQSPLLMVPIAFGVQLAIGDARQLTPALGLALTIYIGIVLACVLGRARRVRQRRRNASRPDSL